MKTLCVIPVRGGSKGIPRKNLAEIVGGVSLLEWTIRQARAVYAPDEIMVSTEDAEMASAARDCDARVIPRPEALAQDESTTASVVEHMLAELDPGGGEYAAIAILQVTSPLRLPQDIFRAREMIETGAYDSVVSAYPETATHPAKMYILRGGMAHAVLPEFETARRQDLPPVYRRNGAIFMVTRAHFERTGRLLVGRTGLAEMPRERSIDVDAPADLEAARRYLADHREDWDV